MGKDQVYRSKLKADPVRYANYLRKEVERRAKRKKAGNIKSISDMSERQQRRRWRKAQKKSRQKNQQLASISTPEASPTIFAGIGTPETSPIPSCSGTKKAVGRKMVRRDRSKAYRTIDKLNSRIETLEVELGRKKKEVKKIQKRNERLTSKLTFKDTPRSKARRLIKEDGKGDKVKTALIKHFAVMSVIKQHRKSTKLEAQKKRQYKDILSKKVIWACRIRTQLRKDFRIYNRSAKARRTTDKRHRVASTIHKFLKRDDVSICQPGKKQCVTRHGVKKQKQVLIKSMMLSYEKFCGESVCEKVSYATFCRYRPFWIVAASLGNRDTCACKRHENLQFMANKLLFNKVITTNNLTALAETLCCHKQNKHCSYRTCTGCMNNKIPQNVFTATDTVEYCSWEVANHEYTKDGITHTSKVTDKIQKKSTLGDLLDLFNEDLKSKLAHLFNIRHQYETLNTLKTVLGPDEAIIHIDFSENYQGKGFREIQSKHFGASHRQLSLHTGIIYTQMAHQCFCTFSDCTRHDPSALWAHLDPILVNLDSSVKTVHFVSDGPTTQYRNKMNFYLASTRLFDYGIKMVTWNMLEAGHGKGAADGVGGSIKRAADRYVAEGADIENAHAMVTQLQSSHSSIKMYVIDKEAVEDIDKTLPPKSQVKTFPGTMKVHQLCSSVDHRGHAYFRDVSCFCKSPEVCMCYDNKPFKISDKGLQSNGDLRKCAGGNANGATGEVNVSASDGATAEVNVVSAGDGATAEVSVVSTAEDATAEVNVVSAGDGATAEVNVVSAGDCATAEVNVVSAAEEVTAEVNVSTCDGVTAEVNVVSAGDGSMAELNVVSACHGATTEGNMSAGDINGATTEVNASAGDVSDAIGDVNAAGDSGVPANLSANAESSANVSVTVEYSKYLADNANDGCALVNAVSVDVSGVGKEAVHSKTVTAQSTSNVKLNNNVTSSDIMLDNNFKNCVIDTVNCTDFDQSMIGKWCRVRYDSDVFPGVITDVDKVENEIEVKTMQPVQGIPYRYSWPKREDKLWYDTANFVGFLSEPKRISSRVVELIA